MIGSDETTFRDGPQRVAWAGQCMQRCLVLVAALSSLLLANMPIMVKEAKVLGQGEVQYGLCVYSPLPPRGRVPQGRSPGLCLVDPVKNNAYGLLAAGLTMLFLVRPGRVSAVVIAAVGAYFFVVFARTLLLHSTPPLRLELAGEKALVLIVSLCCWSAIAVAFFRRRSLQV